MMAISEATLAAMDQAIESLRWFYGKGWTTVGSASKATQDSYTLIGANIETLATVHRNDVIAGRKTVEWWATEASKRLADIAYLAEDAYAQSTVAQLIAFLRDVAGQTAKDVVDTTKKVIATTTTSVAQGIGFALVMLAALWIFVVVRR